MILAVLLRIWARLAGIGGVVRGWAGRHPLPAILALSLAGNVWQWHEHGALARRDRRQIAAWQAALTRERGAYAALRAGDSALRGQIARQNAGIDALAQASQSEQARATAALAAAQRRAQPLMRQAAGLNAAAGTQGAAADAGKTPDSVLAARGDL